MSFSQVLNHRILRLSTCNDTTWPASKFYKIGLGPGTLENFAQIFDKFIFLFDDIFLFDGVALD
jgi:hypothetical protein